MINCIKICFDQEDLKMYALSEQVLMKAAKHHKYEEELEEVIQHFFPKQIKTLIISNTF